MRTLGDIKPGQTIGRYEFLVPIAEGGMASVWAARMKGTRGFQKTLAIKMMLATLSDNPQFEEMFLDEARIASRIHHPNVVEIFDLGEENEVLYLVMEFVDGEPMSTIFRTAQKKSGIPIGIAVRIVADACAGLHAAHELVDEETGQTVGLVHRDVSPQNILVTHDGTVKIVDFGVAKADGRESEKTMAGTVKGKAPYMSPEQALGKEIDRRTDIFALGIFLYHLTTGKHPFRAENDILTLHNIIERPAPPPSTLVPNYPRPLEAAVMKALEKSPGKRFQTCAEFEAALDRVMPPTAPRVRPADVGRFVREVVGDRGEKRREALRAAVRLADERLQNDLDAAKLASKPVSEIGLTAPLSAVSVSGVRSDLIPTAITSNRSPGGPPPLPSPSSLDGRPSLTPLTPGSQPSITAVGAPGLAATKPPPAGSEPGAPASSHSRRPVLLAAALTLTLAVSGVAAFAATRARARSSPRPPTAAHGEPTQPTSPVAPVLASASATSSQAAPSGSDAPAPADSALALDPLAGDGIAPIDLNSLPSETRQFPHGGGPYVRPPKGAPVAPPSASAPVKPRPGSGFVPPPLNDPGF